MPEPDVLQIAKDLLEINPLAAGRDWFRALAEYVVRREEGVHVDSDPERDFQCPACEMMPSIDGYPNYCPNCGVRLLWGGKYGKR